VTNTLAYHDTELITTEKSLTAQAPWCSYVPLSIRSCATVSAYSVPTYKVESNRTSTKIIIILLINKNKHFLAFVLNFRNRCKMFHFKNFLRHLSRMFPQTFNRSIFIKFPFLIMLLISFNFDQGTSFLYKYLCIHFIKSVLKWTFCQSCYSRKSSIV
jgi:hypothetical protein